MKKQKISINSLQSQLLIGLQFLRNTIGDQLYLKKILDAVNSMNDTGNGKWSLCVNEVEIPVSDSLKHVCPTKLANNKLALFMSLTWIVDGEKWRDFEDCIEELYLNVTIKNCKDFGDESYETGFHIDKMKAGEDENEMHPLYHIHFFNSSKKGDFASLNLDNPRIMHHPVDLFIGLMLVLANYNFSIYNKIKQNNNFMSCYRNSIDHILVPYFKSIANMPFNVCRDYAWQEGLCPYL